MMFPTLSSGAGHVISFAAGFVPSFVSDGTNLAKDVALDFFSSLAQSRGGGAGIPAYRPIKSLSFYQEFKAAVEEPYLKDSMFKQLQKRPKCSKACLISDYLEALFSTKITHKIYTKLKKTWGYQQFFRLDYKGSMGLATAFIMHVLLEYSPRTTTLLHNELITYFKSVLSRAAHPQFQEPLKPMVKALIEGHEFIRGITSSDACLFLDTLGGVLVADFFQANSLTEDLTPVGYLNSLEDSGHKENLKATLALLGENYPTGFLISLLGSKQSFFGHNPIKKFQFIMSHLPHMLLQVKNRFQTHPEITALFSKLSDTRQTSSFQERFSSLDPLRLFNILAQDPFAIEHAHILQPVLIEVFKQTLVNHFMENSSLFLEGFPYSRRTSRDEFFNDLASDIALHAPCLCKLVGIDPARLQALAQAMESHEDITNERQLRFAAFLGDHFEISFILHSWENSHATKRLKIQHIGKWPHPSCHLVLFPENGFSRVDLLTAQGLYASREDLSDLIYSSTFKNLKRHGSETLADIAYREPEASLPNQLLAKHFLYYRLHIFACLQKLHQQKLPLLRNTEKFDAAGSNEDDDTAYNPYPTVLPHFENETHRIMYRIEKHLSGLNREFAELSYLTDCVFSHTKHEAIISTIRHILKRGKKAVSQFYYAKIPALILGLRTLTETSRTKASPLFTALATKASAYRAVNPSQEADFIALFAKTHIEDITAAEIVHLIPRLNLENNPPKFFRDFETYKSLIEAYKEAHAISYEELNRDCLLISQQIAEESACFLAFYPPLATQFATLFNPSSILSTSSETVDSFIPTNNLQHEVIKQTLAKMHLLSKKLKRIEFKRHTLDSRNLAFIQSTRRALHGHRDAFIAINPTKTAQFDSLLTQENILLINTNDLSGLRLVPKMAHEDAKIYKELKELLQAIKHLQSALKEQKKLEQNYAAYQARPPAALEEVELDLPDDHHPDAGSLGEIADDAASVGGASYSSDLNSINSVTDFASSFL